MRIAGAALLVLTACAAPEGPAQDPGLIDGVRHEVPVPQGLFLCPDGRRASAMATVAGLTVTFADGDAVPMPQTGMGAESWLYTARDGTLGAALAHDRSALRLADLPEGGEMDETAGILCTAAA